MFKINKILSDLEITELFVPEIENIIQDYFDNEHRKKVQIEFDDKSAFKDDMKNDKPYF